MSSMTSEEIKRQLLLLNDSTKHIPTMHLNKYLKQYSDALISEHMEAVTSSLRNLTTYDEDSVIDKVTRAIRAVNRNVVYV